MELFTTVICCFMQDRTSEDTVSVLYLSMHGRGSQLLRQNESMHARVEPDLSSQYMVLMRYSCWMLSTGHKSVVISSSVRFCLLPMTRNWTA